MIQIDCAVTDTKTLHIRDTHLRHNNDFKNNASSNLKQHNGIKLFYFYTYHFKFLFNGVFMKLNIKKKNVTGHRNNIAHKPYFVRQSYSGSMFSKMNHELPSY